MAQRLNVKLVRYLFVYLFVFGSDIISFKSEDEQDYANGVIFAFFPLMLTIVATILFLRIDVIVGLSAVIFLLGTFSFLSMLISYIRFGNRKNYKRFNAMIGNLGSGDRRIVRFFAYIFYVFAILSCVISVVYRRALS